MLKRIIEGRYNTTNYERCKYKKVRYRSIYVFKDQQGNLVKFEGNYFAEIEGAVQDAIRYLKHHNIRDEFVLYFNNAKINLTADSDANLIIDEYLATYRDRIFEEYDNIL